jgi:hypothetical protein
MGTTFDEVRIWRDPACPACGERISEAPAVPASAASA